MTPVAAYSADRNAWCVFLWDGISATMEFITQCSDREEAERMAEEGTA